MNGLFFRLRKRASVLLALGLLLAGGCASPFLVSKDCRTHFLGSSDESFHAMLCASGDFRRILEDTLLPQDRKDALYSSQCTERSSVQVKRAYASLTKDQKRELRFSFQRHGYDVNYKPVPLFRLGYGFDDDLNFCPREKE